MSPKLQLLSGHAEEKNLAIYRELALALTGSSGARCAPTGGHM